MNHPRSVGHINLTRNGSSDSTDSSPVRGGGSAAFQSAPVERNGVVKTRFDRRELKFDLDARQHAGLKQDIGAHMDPDPFGDVRGIYPVVSLYYDTHEFDAYYERLRGIRPRHKLRLRAYALGTAQEAVFVEIKTKLRRRVVKRRVPLPMDKALRLCRGEAPDTNLPDPVRAIVDEVIRLVRYRDLQPQIVIRYDRAALTGRGADAALRVTFDSGVTYRRSDLENLYRTDFDDLLLPPDRLLLEAKVDEVIPLWLSLKIASHGGLLRSFSKYSRGIELSRAIETVGVGPEFRTLPVL